MMIDVLVDEEDVVLYPICRADDCGREVRSITYVIADGQVIGPGHQVKPGDTIRFEIVARPCGHVQVPADGLTWVVRDAEPDCGV